MKKTIYLFILSFLILNSTVSNAQTVVYSEDFTSGATWTLNTDPTSEDALPNQWYISCQEEGVGSGLCGTACASGDQTLHVSTNAGIAGDLGAAYVETGAAFTGTNRRAESGNISTVGFTGLTFSFDMIGNGGNPNDYTEVFYSINGGTSWVSIASALTSTCCGGPCTGTEQGFWQTNTYALPVVCENIATLRISFVWKNIDDGTATDPSFAVDNIQITTPAVGAPPIADFSTAITTICEGNCIDYINLGTYAAGATFSWNFGDGQTSSAEDPTGICYNNSGTFNVTLTITDANGSDVEMKSNYITVNPTLSAGLSNSANMCNSTTINLTTLLSGADSGGTWTETTATPSGQFTAATAIFDANGVAPGIYTFDYSMTGTAPCPNTTATMTITVTACTGPIAAISASSLTVCAGQSIIFNDNSTGVNINTWTWTFGSGTPGTANTPGPHSITFNTSGTFNIWLQVTDDNGTADEETIQVTVVPCSAPTAAFAISDATICPDDCITFNNNSTTTGPTTYLWTFNGGSPATSTSETPGTICYATSGTHEVSLLVTNGFGFNTYTQFITVQNLPTIAATGGAVIDPGQTVNIGATASDGIITWSASPTSQYANLNCIASDCSTAEVSPVLTTIYTATTTTSEGCTASDMVIIAVNSPAGGYTVGVPNSFSPDGLNGNNVLRVRSFQDKLISVMDFKVYNRYGQLVFETTDSNEGWDGKFNGEDEKPATFVYTLEYTLVDGTSGKLNGNVTLIR